MKNTSAEAESNPTNIKKTVTNVHNYFKEYCSSTSIHGFRYFGEERSTFEKFWWVVIFILCLSGCSFMIYKIWEKYETTPVIVAFATKETSLYNIPFPAVTICPEDKSDRERFNFTDMVNRKNQQEELSEESEKKLQHAAMVCDGHTFDSTKNLTKFETLSDDFFETLDQIKPPFFIIGCEFLGHTLENCSTVVTPIFTDEGVCYSFNSLDRGHIFNDLVHHYKDYHKVEQDDLAWSMDKGYADSRMEAYPHRALLSGASNGLTLTIISWVDNTDYMCKSMQGFKVVLHSPVRIPRLKQEYFRVNLDETVVAAVEPLLITTSEAVKKFDKKKRDCLFPSEGKLHYFRTYSQQNCLLECLTTITLRECGCVDIYMPRTNTTSICGLGKQSCVKKAETAWQRQELNNKAQGSSNSNPDSCDCLPLCTDLSYNVETSQTKWDWKETINLMALSQAQDLSSALPSIRLSKLTIYFRFNHFIASERQELYGPTDFVANFGGLLGLFTGFSILSLMEIIYFLTVRICCNIRMYGKWSGEN